MAYQMMPVLLPHEPSQTHLFPIVRYCRIVLPHFIIGFIGKSLPVEIETSPFEHIRHISSESRAWSVLPAVRIVLRHYEVPVFISLVRHRHPQLVYVLQLKAPISPFYGKDSGVVHPCR